MDLETSENVVDSLLDIRPELSRCIVQSRTTEIPSNPAEGQSEAPILLRVVQIGSAGCENCARERRIILAVPPESVRVTKTREIA